MSTSRSPWSCVLWDVDGTIVDASDGILERLGITMQRFGHPEVTRAELVHWIGPPMFESFQIQLGMTPDEAADAVTFYRSLTKDYTTGVRLFPGIADLVRDLHDAGVPQAISSSKPETQVLDLTDHFGLTPFFTAIVGASADERTLAAKSAIVAEALRRLRSADIETTRPVLIGDRHHDITGGDENDVPVIFVRWGFSWPHEAEGAQAVVDDAAQLRDLVLLPGGDA